MIFRTVCLPKLDDFLSCFVATTVFHDDVRVLREIAERVLTRGYEWCIAHRDPQKVPEWWAPVREIDERFMPDLLAVGQPITAKVHQGSLEFGSFGEVGGGCHRTIAIAVRAMRDITTYKPFNILLRCD